MSVGGIAWTAGRCGFGGLRVSFTALVGTRPHSTARCSTPWSIVVVLRIASIPTPAGSDRRELAVVADEHELDVEPTYPLDQLGELAGGKHACLVDDEDRAPWQRGERMALERLEQGRDARARDAGAFLKLTRRALFRTLRRVKSASRNLQHITHSRMPVLPHQRNRPIIKNRHHARPARMMHDLALVGYVTLAHRIDRNVYHAPVINLFRAENLRGFFVRHCHNRRPK